jgi:hypothetical protein
MVNRTEHGLRAPTVQEITALCKVYRVDTETRAVLQSIARDLKEGVTSSRTVLQRPKRMQERIKRIEQASSLIREFQSSIVIGLAQTREYAQLLLGPDLVQSRIERQEILDTSRTFVLLHTEGALRWHVGSPEIMAAQVEHIAELVGRPNVRVGLIPWNKPVRVPVRHPFHIYDMHTVIVGTEVGTAFIGDSRIIRDYDQRFAEFEQMAVFGGDARIELERIAADYRGLG